MAISVAPDAIAASEKYLLNILSLLWFS